MSTSVDSMESYLQNMVPSESNGDEHNGLISNIQLEQNKDKQIYDLEKQNSELKKRLNTFQATLAISFVIFISCCGIFVWSYVTKPTDCTNGINRIQNLLESELKRDNRIILRPLWANEELKANATDLKPLSLPVTGVIAHHTSVGENRCFTIGKLQNYKL